ncbi:unnamed protein product [Caenorhabditis sp. 36 PRJEB53466]|nr:unnamed protein product [Caenorhabditis sp. 36 PRJEB53466]
MLAEEETDFDFDGLEDEFGPYPFADYWDIKELSEFIGGFEKWNLLNVLCKTRVIGYLDEKTKIRLARCSKSDYDNVKMVPAYIHTISLTDNQRMRFEYQWEPFDNATVKFQFGSCDDDRKHVELVFSPLGEDTQLRWIDYERHRDGAPVSHVIRKCNYSEEAVKCAEQWLKKCKFGVDGIDVQMVNNPPQNYSIEPLPFCQNIRLRANSENELRWWMGKLPEKIKNIHIYEGNRDDAVLSADFLSLPQLMNAQKISFHERCAYTDQQFLDLKSKMIRFNSMHITDKGINQFIRRWVNGGGIEDFGTAELLAARPENDNHTEITFGLAFWEWNPKFKQDNHEFCQKFGRLHGVGTCYQVPSRVDSLQSLTVCISTECVTISATGKRDPRQNRTTFEVPSVIDLR